MLVFRDLYDFSQIDALEAFSGYNTLLQLPGTGNLPEHRYVGEIFWVVVVTLFFELTSLL